MSGCEGATPDQLSIAVEQRDFERDFGALEHARSRAPRGLCDHVSERKIAAHGMFESSRRYIGGEDPLAQRERRPRLLRQRGRRPR